MRKYNYVVYRRKTDESKLYIRDPHLLIFPTGYTDDVAQAKKMPFDVARELARRKDMHFQMI